MNRLLTGLFSVYLLIIFVEIGYYLFLIKDKFSFTSSINQSSKMNSSTPFLSPTKKLSFTPLVQRLDFVEGKVFGWEDIPNSSDKYLVLANEKTNKPIIKARIVFDKEAATSPAKFATGFGKRKTEDIEFEVLGPIANYGFSKVKDLIDKSKTILIMPIYDNPKDSTFEKDENGQMIAQWLVYLE